MNVYHQRLARCAVLLAVLWLSPLAFGQDVVVSTPFQSTSSSFFENIGVGFGANFGSNGPFFNQGSFNSAIPPFGNFAPNSVGRFGFRAGPFSFNFAAGQGSQRTFTSTTPMVVVPNGGVGTIVDVRQQPFVTGIIPVVGSRDRSPLFAKIEQLRQAQAYAQSQKPQQAQIPNLKLNKRSTKEKPTRNRSPEVGLTRASAAVSRDSSATRGDLSVAEIRRQQSAQQSAEKSAQNSELQQMIEQARGAEERGRKGAARIYYKQAAKRAMGELRQQLLAKAESLRTERK